VLFPKIGGLGVDRGYFSSLITVGGRKGLTVSVKVKTLPD
jgi:hypothetical protein